MIRSRLFLKLFATFVGLTLLSALAIAVLTYGWERKLLEQRAWQQLRQAVASNADHFGEWLADDIDNQQLAELAARLAEQSDVRITVISNEGRVVADSAVVRGELSTLDNQRLRPEVAGALSNGESQATRQSLVIGEPMLYFAQRVDHAGAKVGVVRAALPQSQIIERLRVFAGALAIMTAAIAVVAALVTYVVVRRLVRPIVTLNEAAHGIAQGEYGHRVFVPGNDELGALARSFNNMSFALGKQVSELRASDQRQATVLGGMIEGVVAVDRRQRVLFANSAAGRLFGFSPLHVQGRPLIEVIRHHELHGMLQRAINQGTAGQLDMQWEGLDERQLAVQITPLPGQPSPGAVIVLHDNTELRRLETIRSEFMANVSHELKTPLSSIKAYCETLMDGAIDDLDNRMRFLQRIAEQGDRLNDLIQDMLSLARIESDLQHFELLPVSVDGLARKCVDDHRALAEAKRIELTTGDGVATKVVADEEGLRVILNNLVDNAIKYTPVDGKVRVDWKSNGSGLVRLSVADNGAGIPRADLPRIFERFYRVDKARSRELGSTGLGLSIVKHLAHSFGGSAGVESTVGKGSTFWVDLPVAGDEQQPPP